MKNRKQPEILTMAEGTPRPKRESEKESVEENDVPANNLRQKHQTNKMDARGNSGGPLCMLCTCITRSWDPRKHKKTMKQPTNKRSPEGLKEILCQIPEHNQDIPGNESDNIQQTLQPRSGCTS